LPAAVEDAELQILLAEFRDDVGAYLANVEQGPRTLADLIEFNLEHASEVMPHFGQELLLQAQASGGSATPAYAAARETAANARTALGALFAMEDLDALVAPANSRAWRIDYPAGDEHDVSSSGIAAVTGYPSAAVPIARSPCR
jgi:amidase